MLIFAYTKYQSFKYEKQYSNKNQIAQKQSDYQMLQVYTLNPLIAALIISKMLYKLSLNKNPLQVQLNRLSDYYKHLAIEFRNQITDERQMKMTLFKIVFPSDKTLIQICKSNTIYTYFNDFIQQELILKLLRQKFESSSHYDMNLLSSSTSFNYIIGKKGLQTPYLHYHQKFQKVQQKNQAPSVPQIDFNIKDKETGQKKADKQFFGHLLKQKIKTIGASLFKYKGIAALVNNNHTQNKQGQKVDLNTLIKKYRDAIKKQKTIQFNNEQTTVKYPNQQTQKRKIQQDDKKYNGGSTLNIFKEISPVDYSFVAKNNHFYQYNIYQKSLQLRSYLELILYLFISSYCLVEFFKILDLSHLIVKMNKSFMDVMFQNAQQSLKAEIELASKTYTPTYSVDDISYLKNTDLPQYCQKLLVLITNNIQKYVTGWQDDCIIFMQNFTDVQSATANFDRSIYFIYLIPIGNFINFKYNYRQIFSHKFIFFQIIIEFIRYFLVYQALCLIIFQLDNEQSIIIQLKKIIVNILYQKQWKQKLFIQNDREFSNICFLIDQGLLKKQKQMNYYFLNFRTYLFYNINININLGFLMNTLHAKLVNVKISYDLTEYADIFLVFLCIQHYFSNKKIQEVNDLENKNRPHSAEFAVMLKNLIYVLTLILFCLFIKIFQFFSRTEKLGVFVKIIILTIKQVIAFLILFMLNICAFASLFFLLSSYRLSDYSDFLSSLRALIATSLGTFDFSEMNTAESIIQTVFLYSSNVIMINLLIAIMTKTYSQITERSNVEYALILQEEFQVGKLDKNYSLLIAFPPPLNIFSIAFSWTLFFQKLRDFNSCFVKIGYSILLLVVFAIFFIINLLIVPFAYLKILYSISKYQLQSIGLNIILQQRKQLKQKKLFWKGYIWCLIRQWLILLFKIFQWLILGLPYLIFHSVVTDSYTFIKSAYNTVENKYFYSANLINTPIPQRYYYMIKCQPKLIDFRYQTNFITSNYHLVKNYLKFKYLVKQAKRDQELVKNGSQPILKNYFLKVLKQLSRRKKNINQFNLIFESEYQKLKDIREDVIHNEHTDQSFLAIMRTKQIYNSTEFWEKNKVTSSRQSKFYHLAINPSIKHQLFVQQTLIRKVQSQNQNISHIKNIQQQMSLQQPSSHNSLSKMNSNVAFIKQQTQKKKLKTLIEQIDIE